jgi:hypothetical protein
MMGELERSETLPPGFPSRPATSNRRNSTKRNCAKVRKLQTPGSDFSVWLQADQPPALPGIWFLAGTRFSAALAETKSPGL